MPILQPLIESLSKTEGVLIYHSSFQVRHMKRQQPQIPILNINLQVKLTSPTVWWAASDHLQNTIYRCVLTEVKSRLSQKGISAEKSCFPGEFFQGKY